MKQILVQVWETKRGKPLLLYIKPNGTISNVSVRCILTDLKFISIVNICRYLSVNKFNEKYLTHSQRDVIRNFQDTSHNS
jgi:hypothetical protein